MMKLLVQASSWIAAAVATGPNGLWKETGTYCASAIAAIFLRLQDAADMHDVGLQHRDLVRASSACR